MIKPNRKLQDEIKATGVRQWQIADALGISDSTLSKMLRYPLTDEQKQAIKQAVKAVKEAN